MYLKNLRTGTMYRVLGSTPSANAPHLTTVWVQKVDQPKTCLPWSASSMQSGYHDFVAVDEHGNQQER
jgi:hypothetical protein